MSRGCTHKSNVQYKEIDGARQDFVISSFKYFDKFFQRKANNQQNLVPYPTELIVLELKILV